MIISDRYLIWIGSDQEKTFGPTISGLIHRNLGPDRLTLWDSKKRGLVHVSSIPRQITESLDGRRASGCHETHKRDIY